MEAVNMLMTGLEQLNKNDSGKNKDLLKKFRCKGASS